MDIIIICTTAFFVSILTFFSGFGLGTILTPVFMVFFPVDLAIALTGVVHFFNNIFKVILVGRNANRDVVLRFGIPAVIAAIIGAWILLHIPDAAPLFSYEMAGKTFEIYPVKLLISILLLIFAILDLVPFFNNLNIRKSHLPIGGLLSGFFGGLSGHQGALRSAFLIKAGLSKEAFIGTAVLVSTFVDFTRLSVYATRFVGSDLIDNLPLVVYATIAAIIGAYFGNRLLKKVTIRFLQIIVAVMLIILSIAFGLGWI
jgi:uncharacterized membrane protein YfcA